jgi:hypothetical protein
MVNVQLCHMMKYWRPASAREARASIAQGLLRRFCESTQLRAC